MNVMLVSPGASVHSVRPLQWLLARGCRVLFVDDVKPAVTGTRPFAYARDPYSSGRRNWLGWRLSHWVARQELRWLRRSSRADVVHVQWVDRRAWACADAGLKPLVLTVWGSDVNLMLETGADADDRRRVGEALAAADLVIVDSTDMPAKCAELAGRPVPTALLPLGIDTTRFRPVPQEQVAAWRRNLDISDAATVFMSVRAWGPRYGHGHILEAFAQARTLSDCRMVLVFKVYNSRDYPAATVLEDTLRRRAAELGLQDHVRWLREVAVDELPVMYGVADCILNCPEVDAFPVTFIEAAACQCPLITVDLPAYGDTFVHEFFRVVPVGDIAALAMAMRDVAREDRRESRDRLAPARRLMIDEFDETLTTDRLVGYYQRAMQPSLQPDPRS